jgi:hypothetical protein
MTNDTDNLAEAIRRFLASCDQTIEDYRHLLDRTYESHSAQPQTGRQTIRDLMKIRPILVATPEMINDLRDGIEAAQRVIDTWSQGDLAGAVNGLEQWIASARVTLAKVGAA